MRIVPTKEMKEFFNRCLNNIQDDRLNDYLGVVIESEEDAKVIQRELSEIGDPEFAGDESTWPSLYISTDEYKKTPYNSNISLKDKHHEGFEFNYEDMPANELINMDFIQPDPNRELNDYMILRAFDKPYKATVLRQDGEFWMTDNPAEAKTVDPCVDKAYGNVLTFGLGIGYFVYMCLLKPEVKSVTIVELNESVINMFKELILPQFPKDKEIKIIHGNAFDYFNEDFLKKFDYVFVDVWKNNSDGYPMIEKMLEQYLPTFEHCDFWIESTCFENIISMVCVYFYCIALGLPLPKGRGYTKRYKKIDKYFKKMDIEVRDVDTLKDLMYDPKVLREIVSQRV